MISLEHIRYGFDIVTKGQHPKLIEQVHQAKIIEISSRAQQAELFRHPMSADGVFTTRQDLEMYVFTADCLPVILFSSKDPGPVAAIHCGWRGARLGIVRTALTLLRKYSNDIHAVIGPAIRKCCYEIREDLIQSFEQKKRPIGPFLSRRNGRTYFDLPDFVVETDLFDLEPMQIRMTDHRCTCCSKPELPSYRRTKSTSPRIRAWVRKVVPSPACCRELSIS